MGIPEQIVKLKVSSFSEMRRHLIVIALHVLINRIDMQIHAVKKELNVYL